MIKIRPGTEPTGELVTRIIEVFRQKELPRLQKLEKYYRVETAIKSRNMPAEKPNNQIAHGFAKYISNMATGYFMGEGIRHEVSGDDKYKELIIEALEEETSGDTPFETAKEMSKKGIAYEILYINERAEIRCKRFAAEEIIPVYSFSVDEFLEFAIRLWSEEDLLTKKTTYYAEVYTRREIITFTARDENGKYTESSEERRTHFFSDVPVVVYWNNEEQKGDFEDVMDLIDAYDQAQSDTANDFEYFTDAYLVLVGAGGGLVSEGDGEDDGKALRTLKQERVLLLDEKGQAQWLIKEINDAAVENYKNRIYNDMFFLSQVPALTDESFAGNLSGVAIRYKLIGLEQLAAMKEKKFIAAYRKKIRLVTEYLNLRFNKTYDASNVAVKFDRNMTENLLELANVASLLDGIVSKETLLALLPFVKDAKKELERLVAERDEEYDFGDIDDETRSKLNLPQDSGD